MPVTVGEEAQKAEQKRAEANRKRRERVKRKREEKAGAAGQSSGEAEKVTKKLRTTEPDTAQKVTIYIEIHPPAPQQPSRAGKKPIRPIIKKGPAFFTLDDNFDEFKKIIAKTIPCKPKLLPIDKMEWRYEKPANDPKKPLVSAEGFEAMNISLLERKTGFVLYISIPPPKQDDAVSLIITFRLIHSPPSRPGIPTKAIMWKSLTITLRRHGPCLMRLCLPKLKL